MKLIERFKKTKTAVWGLIFVFVFYSAGAALMKRTDVEPIKEMGVANQEEYTYTDSNGDDHEGQTLIEIKGLGSVLTYQDIYFASIPMFLISCIIGHFIFHGDDAREIEYAMFANCVLGVLLIRLTSTGNIASTILFWLGIIAASFVRKPKEKNT